MKKIAFAVAVAVSNLVVQPALAEAVAQASPAATAGAPAFSTDETTIGDLLDNKATNEVLIKYLPEIVSSDQIDLARNMTLRQIQQYSPDELTDAKLAEVDKALSELKQ
jgi:para-nitrobenzyl esterase